MTSIPGLWPLDQQRKVGAQQMRVLRAGPDADCAVLKIGNRAGRTDRAMHLIGPDIGTLHRLCGGLDRGVDVTLVEQDARRRGIGAERLLNIIEAGKRRHRLPGDVQLRRCLDRVLLALGDDADEIADPHHRNNPGDIAYRGFIDRDQAGADERARRRRRHRAGERRGHAACRAPAHRGHRPLRRSPWREDRPAAPIARRSNRR